MPCTSSVQPQRYKKQFLTSAAKASPEPCKEKASQTPSLGRSRVYGLGFRIHFIAVSFWHLQLYYLGRWRFGAVCLPRLAWIHPYTWAVGLTALGADLAGPLAFPGHPCLKPSTLNWTPTQGSEVRQIPD